MSKNYFRIEIFQLQVKLVTEERRNAFGSTRNRSKESQ